MNLKRILKHPLKFLKSIDFKYQYFLVKKYFIYKSIDFKYQYFLVKKYFIYMYYERKSKRWHTKHKNDKYRLTVLLVTYNHKEYITKTIESIVMQKTNFKFKIVIADDCSTDGTSDIVREYAKKYPDLIFPLIREKNMGIPKSFFYALKNIDTEYYCSIEGDDYYTDPMKLQMQVDILDQNFDCIYCSHNVTKHYIDKNEKEDISNKEQGKYDVLWTHTLGKMYRTYAIKGVNIKDAVLLADGPVCYYMANFGKCYYIDRVMATYKITKKGIYTSLDKDIIDILVRIENEMIFLYILRNINYISKERWKKIDLAQYRKDFDKLKNTYYYKFEDFIARVFKYVENKQK